MSREARALRRALLAVLLVATGTTVTVEQSRNDGATFEQRIVLAP
jgi:hypothetical protein